jgi:hypothetical protein
MCVTPCYLDDGTEVACRYCWQCKSNRVNDLVGRCIAESKYAKKTYAITLTYAETAGVKSVTLEYKDVQTFLKRLRRRYGKVRYICAGEYGTARGRAHWHIVIFFKEKYPEPGNMPQLRFGEELPPNEYRVDWEPWEHGFSYFQPAALAGEEFQYLMKYALKDQELDSSDAKLSMSKKPPLGHEFIMNLAREHVDQAVIPRTFKYKIGGVKKNNGQEKVFMMQGKTREDFMTAFKTGCYKKTKLFDGWEDKYGKEPQSEFYDEWDEKNYLVEYTDEELVKRLHHKDVMYYEPWKQMGIDEDQGTWIEANYYGNEIVIHGKKDETWIYEDGEWREDRANAAEIIGLSEIKRIRTFEEAQREELEQLVQLHEKQRRSAEQYQ